MQIPIKRTGLSKKALLLYTGFSQMLNSFNNLKKTENGKKGQSRTLSMER